MKRLLFSTLLLLCPTTAYASEQAVIGEQTLDCKHVTYLQHVDITVGEQCARSLQHAEPTRTFFDVDPIAAPLLTTWASRYAFAAPAYEPLHEQTIAILDTGFTTNSGWLQSFVTHTYDVVAGTTVTDDTIHHGTAVVASAALAMQHAPADIIVIKIDQNGSLSIPNIVKGIDYAIEQGADIINMSLGGTYIDEREQHAIEKALAQNITITAAAGNEGHTYNKLNYPASYEGVLSIGAIDEQQQRANFSNYNEQLSFVLPGASLPLIQDDQINEISGTSFSSPFAAGLIAALQQYSDASFDVLHNALKRTAIDLEKPGYDIATGYGLIHANDALQWLRGDEQLLRTMTNPFITVTFSNDVSPNTTLTLYKDRQIVATTTTVTNDTATVTPEHILYNETYMLKLDRSVTSAEGVALSEPMYVPIQFVQ
ncbi:S8 family peptidase [Caryophanon latum]|uniref:Uncharacterized protein n=1 Tax=Caryophanon latum TaxID=33977 RepID=A0A1C0YE94_9BACL|nr:S8 family serine peptidase [Caryophanon latum]OCS85480.1 hypothetical protein A6K76_15130 [Caryophanon latum]